MSDVVPNPAAESGESLLLKLEGFEGPLDLLLDLARAQKVDLAKISILSLVDQYLAVIEGARAVRLELAAEWLVMAAWLTWLKSRLLVPAGADDAEDPELAAELLTGRLQALELIRAAAGWLSRRPILGTDVFGPGEREDHVVVDRSRLVIDQAAFLSSYLRAVRRGTKAVTYQPRPLSWFTVQDALRRLTSLLGSLPDWSSLERFLPDSAVAGPLQRRAAISSTFIAGLEMARGGAVRLRQDEAFGTILVGPGRPGDAEPDVTVAPVEPGAALAAAEPNVAPEAPDANVAPAAPEPRIAPVAREPNTAPVAREPNTAPVSREPGIAPATPEPDVAPAAREPNVAPAAPEPNVAPAARESTIAPVAREPTIAPVSREPDVAPSAREPDEASLRLAEAAVFASQTPMTPRALSQILPDDIDTDVVIAALRARYAGRGIELAEVGGGLRFRTAQDLAAGLRKVVQVPRRLPRVAMETLAIVAYHQPVTRPEIEDIRGAGLAQNTLDILLENDLITARGRKETPGRPTLWGTTAKFLEYFGLRDIRDLPRRQDLLLETVRPESAAEAADRNQNPPPEASDTAASPAGEPAAPTGRDTSEPDSPASE